MVLRFLNLAPGLWRRRHRHRSQQRLRHVSSLGAVVFEAAMFWCRGLHRGKQSTRGGLRGPGGRAGVADRALRHRPARRGLEAPWAAAGSFRRGRYRRRRSGSKVGLRPRLNTAPSHPSRRPGAQPGGRGGEDGAPALPRLARPQRGATSGPPLGSVHPASMSSRSGNGTGDASLRADTGRSHIEAQLTGRNKPGIIAHVGFIRHPE